MSIKSKKKNIFHRVFNGLVMWFDSDAADGTDMKSEKVNFVRCLPFIALHLSCFAIIWVGWSPVAVISAAVVYLVQMFSITAFYHRYFSHKTFKTTRFFQFLFALIGGTAVQKGALWWAANHRHHHRFSDQEEDIHSPSLRGFWWSHIGWVTADKYFNTNYKLVPDLAKYPELRLLNRFDIFVPIFAGTFIFFYGYFLNQFFPSLGTSGAQMLVWAYFTVTTISLHSTFTINSLSHVWGKQRFKINDTSRNNFFLSLITLGEGWHNNHHRYPAATKQGFYWWEVDVTFYLLKGLSWLGVVWDLKSVPESVYEEAAITKKKKKEKASNTSDLDEIEKNLAEKAKQEVTH